MIRIAIPVVLGSALFLAACGFDKPPPTTSSAVADKAIPGAEPSDKVEPVPLRSDYLAEFAELLVDQGPGFFRFDRLRDARSGGQERQVFVEMIGLNDEQAADLSARVMESLNLEPGNRFGDENGIRLHYSYGDDEPVRILVRTREAHSRLNNDSATSSVYVTQPVPAR